MYMARSCYAWSWSTSRDGGHFSAIWYAMEMEKLMPRGSRGASTLLAKTFLLFVAYHKIETMATAPHKHWIGTWPTSKTSSSHLQPAAYTCLHIHISSPPRYHMLHWEHLDTCEATWQVWDPKIMEGWIPLPGIDLTSYLHSMSICPWICSHGSISP